MKKHAILDIELNSLVIKLFGANFELYENNLDIEFKIDLGHAWRSNAATAGRYDLEMVCDHIDKLKRIFISNPYMVDRFTNNLPKAKQTEIPIILVLLLPKSVELRLGASFSLTNDRIKINIHGTDIA